MVGAEFVHDVVIALPPQRVAEHGGVKEPGQVFFDAPQILGHKAVFAAGIAVQRHPPQHRDHHGLHVRAVLLVEFGAFQPFQGQLFQCFHDGGGGLGLNFLQHGHAFVDGGPRGAFQQGRVQIIVDHIIRQPLLQIGKDAVVQLAIFLPKGGELPIAVQGVVHANLIEQFVNIEESEGQGGFLHLPLPQLGTPGKIPPQLLIRQGLVGGVVAQDRAGKIIVVLVICQQPGLLEEHGLPGLPAALQRAGGAQQGGELFLHRLLPGDNVFVGVDLMIKPVRCVFHSVCIRSPHTPVQMFVIIIHDNPRTVKHGA